MRFDAGDVITAMVTPMSCNGNVDYQKVKQLTEYLTTNGSDSVLITATTGESPTLTHEEEIEILHSAKLGVCNNAKIIMGTGSNSTETAIKMSVIAEQEGADAVLCVAPYYNKPSQAGMIEHFSCIADSVKIPVILYNIPSRTGVNMTVDTISKLAHEHSNIVALKQSYSDMDCISELIMQCPKDFTILSGDDSLTLPMLSIGALGVVSVASHIFGNEIKLMINKYKSGNINQAKNIHGVLYPSFKKLFMAPNPVPIKCALANDGFIDEYVRKPLVTLTVREKEELLSVIKNTRNSLMALLQE